MQTLTLAYWPGRCISLEEYERVTQNKRKAFCVSQLAMNASTCLQSLICSAQLMMRK